MRAREPREARSKEPDDRPSLAFVGPSGVKVGPNTSGEQIDRSRSVWAPPEYENRTDLGLRTMLAGVCAAEVGPTLAELGQCRSNSARDRRCVGMGPTWGDADQSWSTQSVRLRRNKHIILGHRRRNDISRRQRASSVNLGGNPQDVWMGAVHGRPTSGSTGFSPEHGRSRLGFGRNSISRPEKQSAAQIRAVRAPCSGKVRPQASGRPDRDRQRQTCKQIKRQTDKQT